MSVGLDGIVIEQRTPTPIGDTGAVPAGTMVTVPTASVSGPPGSSPVVAVNTAHWYQDPGFMTATVGALFALEPVIEDALRASTFNWKSFVLSCLLALGAYFRNKNNTVLR